MYTGIYHTHKLVVVLFLLIYLIKTVLLLMNKKDALMGFVKKVKVPEMVISFLFLATGLYLIFNTASVSTLLIVKLVLVLASIPIAIVGFKKQNKVLAALSFLLLVGAYGLAEMHKGAKGKKVEMASNVVIDPKAEGYSSTAHGQAIYKGQCIACHGDKGDMGLSGAKSLIASKLKKTEIVEIIKNGKNTMPAYEKIYSDEEIKALTDYVITLRKD